MIIKYNERHMSRELDLYALGNRELVKPSHAMPCEPDPSMNG
jgi:hypothetical protein